MATRRKGREAANALHMQSSELVQLKHVDIPQPKRFGICIEISGTAPLIQNNFSQKSMEQMLAKHCGIAMQREKKQARKLLEAALVKNVDGVVCLPPAGLKKAILSGAAGDKTFKKTQLRIMMHIDGNSVPITWEKRVDRMDIVRTAGVTRAPDIRFRPAFLGWKARFIVFHDERISPESVIELVQRAGQVGVGEWRPEKDGNFGTFKVTDVISDKKVVDDVFKATRPELQPLIIPSWAMDADLSKLTPSAIARLIESDGSDENAAADDPADAKDTSASATKRAGRRADSHFKKAAKKAAKKASKKASRRAA